MLAFDPYATLGAPSNADFDVLKRRYRDLVRQNHPDLARDNAQKQRSTERMSEINRAWAIVSDPQKRADFDAQKRRDSSQQRPQPAPASRRSGPQRRPRIQNAHEKVKTTKHGPATKRVFRIGEPPCQSKSAAREQKNLSLFNQLALERAAQLWQIQGREDEAIAVCHSILRRDFRSVPARRLLADIHLSRGDLVITAVLWEQLALMRPGNAAFRARHQQLQHLLKNQTAFLPPTPSVAEISVPHCPTNPKVTHSPKDGRKETGLWGKLRARIKFRKPF